MFPMMKEDSLPVICVRLPRRSVEHPQIVVTFFLYAHPHASSMANRALEKIGDSFVLYPKWI